MKCSKKIMKSLFSRVSGKFKKEMEQESMFSNSKHRHQVPASECDLLHLLLDPHTEEDLPDKERVKITTLYIQIADVKSY